MSAYLHSIAETIDHGGPVVLAILALSAILYTRAFGLLIHLAQVRRQMQRDYESHRASLAELRHRQDDLQEMFQRQRAVLAAMIAAAPLLGLLGTVTGMIQTFRHLASGSGAQTMGGLADGISEALIATAAGLSVAIPAVLLLYFAHREVQRSQHAFALLEHQELDRYDPAAADPLSGTVWNTPG